ncbi:phosphate/phosphite/phosphonate ABC transporter substrate-binding protein [Paludibacteraceae bacterium OttesenSCG-928-F17]|nr:phosphate/phosphite/phosphonate ABC transporter substrate-binding protein [Paludibacteraceae bacterium OttesenSCG-928-F17]
MKIEIKQEKRNEIERIQREFANQLSEKEILKSTAQAINTTLSRSISNKQKGINAGIKREYNITQKYLSRMAAVSPKANSGHLWGGIMINEGKIPIIGFKPKQAGSHISVQIHKGKTVYVRNSFVATMASGHTGVYSRGKYDKKEGFIPGKEKTESGKIRITQMHTASPFGMGTSKNVSAEVQSFMGDEVLARVEGILRSKVDKIMKL